MAPIAGRPFLEYQLTFLEQSGIRNVILATGYKSEVIFEYLVIIFVHYQYVTVMKMNPRHRWRVNQRQI